MKLSWLIRQLTWRSALRISSLEALLGSIYGASIQMLEYIENGGRIAGYDLSPLLVLVIILLTAVTYGLLGAAFGLIVGALVGLLISAITIRWFLPLRDSPRYLRVVRRSSTLLGGIGTLVGILVMQALFGLVKRGHSDEALLLFGIIPALLASLAIWRGSARIAAWYIRTADAHAALSAQATQNSELKTQNL
jgi:hypothetical protein